MVSGTELLLYFFQQFLRQVCLNWEAQYPTGDNLKAFRAKFSVLSETVLLGTSWQASFVHAVSSRVETSTQVPSCPCLNFKKLALNCLTTAVIRHLTPK
jgi:hypothetical protein